MTKIGYTHITMLVDRTGSMQSIRQDAQGAVNAFIDSHRSAPGECTLTLAEFDDHVMLGDRFHRGGLQLDVLHDGDVRTAPPYRLDPRGNTPLRDAMAHTIRMTGHKLSELPEDERPEHVLFVVQTDGEENASHQTTQEQLNALIRDHEQRWSWSFIFLATGPDAFAQAGAFAGTGMHANNVVRNTGGGVSHAASMSYLAESTVALRSGARSADAAYAATVSAVGEVDEEQPTSTP
jgi:hypothetical protein